MGLEDVQNKLIRNLSRGYKQRVSMAGALVGNPDVIILDEPTVGLDSKANNRNKEFNKRAWKKTYCYIKYTYFTRSKPNM